jgi:hypothetical protein
VCQACGALAALRPVSDPAEWQGFLRHLTGRLTTSIGPVDPVSSDEAMELAWAWHLVAVSVENVTGASARAGCIGRSEPRMLRTARPGAKESNRGDCRAAAVDVRRLED